MNKIIDKIFKLYLIQSYHYLLQYKGGHYATQGRRDKPLRVYQLQAHLDGKWTVGTFAGSYFTKFICFDVDYHDPATAKWITYKLADALNSLRIHDYVVSYSGGKGYHVEIFLDEAITVESARKFYNFIIELADIRSTEGGEVEYRPSDTQGVKLPLGIHQKTGNYCGFCTVGDELRVMNAEDSAAYFLAIKQTDHLDILDIIDEYVSYDNRVASDMENAIGRHKPLEIYDQSESYTLTHAADRYHKGLTGPGQRHKSFLLLARLMNHNGVERADALATLTEWFGWQEKQFYASDWDFCMRDLRECVDHVYDNNSTLVAEQRDLTVTFAEVDAIIRKCPKIGQKALTYAMLVHSKRWAGESGVFYMTSLQMSEAAGMDERTARRNIDPLEKLGVIEIVRRNQAQRGTFMKKPNCYRMTLIDGTNADEGSYEINEAADLGECLRFFYTDTELRRMLPRRQVEAVLTVS